MTVDGAAAVGFLLQASVVAVKHFRISSGVLTNFVRGVRSSTYSVEDRENGDVGAVAL